MNDLTSKEIEALEGNPTKNTNAILIVKDPDGNYRGFMSKNNAIVQTRQGDPNSVLNTLITHP